MLVRNPLMPEKALKPKPPKQSKPQRPRKGWAVGVNCRPREAGRAASYVQERQRKPQNA